MTQLAFSFITQNYYANKKNYSLVGVDGNAFSVMGYVKSAMKEMKFSKKDIDKYLSDAMSKDYDNLIYISSVLIEQCNEKLKQFKEEEKRNKVPVAEERTNTTSEMKTVESLISESTTQSQDTSNPNPQDKESLTTAQVQDTSNFNSQDSEELPIAYTQEEADAILSKWFDDYVPSKGKAKSVGGELVRAIERIRYRWYNDGDLCGYGYGVITCGSAITYIYGEFGELEDFASDLAETDNERDYEKRLDELVAQVINLLKKHPELFTTENSNDYTKSDATIDGEKDFRLNYWDDEEDYDDDDEEDDEDDEY